MRGATDGGIAWRNIVAVCGDEAHHCCLIVMLNVLSSNVPGRTNAIQESRPETVNGRGLLHRKAGFTPFSGGLARLD